MPCFTLHRRARSRGRVLIATVVLIATLGSVSCSLLDRQIQQHEAALQSLVATTQAIANAWLAGHVSGTYAATALQQTVLLIEQERAAVTGKPRTLADPRVAGLADRFDELARVTALLLNDVRGFDGMAARTHVSALAHYQRQETP